jgi:hypothetical protein
MIAPLAGDGKSRNEHGFSPFRGDRINPPHREKSRFRQHCAHDRPRWGSIILPLPQTVRFGEGFGNSQPPSPPGSALDRTICLRAMGQCFWPALAPANFFSARFSLERPALTGDMTAGFAEPSGLSDHG